MNLSQKCQYAIRALFELARREQRGPVRISRIARAQAIPPRFLEVILNELKHAGYVESRRGVQGGYMLAVPSGALTVGEVIRFVDGAQTPVRCLTEPAGADCPLYGSCAFAGLWDRAAKAVSDVYDGTTLRDLVEQDRAARAMPAYCI